MMGKGVLVANVREYLQHKAFWNLFTCAEVPSSGGWRRYQWGGGLGLPGGAKASSSMVPDTLT